jgi:hypothetical protein
MTDLSSFDLSQEQVQIIVDGVSRRKANAPASLKVLSLEIAQYIVDNHAPEDFAIRLGLALRWLALDDDWQFAQYMVENFVEDVDYKVSSDYKVTLSIECFKGLALLMGTEEAKTARKYFIEAEKIARKRFPIARHALLRVLYDVVITKSINYGHAEYAMNESIPYLSTLGSMSKYTIQMCLMIAANALDDVEDGSLQWTECAHIINTEFLRVYSYYKAGDAELPTEVPLTIDDLEDIEFIFYTHYF